MDTIDELDYLLIGRHLPVFDVYYEDVEIYGKKGKVFTENMLAKFVTVVGAHEMYNRENHDTYNKEEFVAFFNEWRTDVRFNYACKCKADIYVRKKLKTRTANHRISRSKMKRFYRYIGKSKPKQNIALVEYFDIIIGYCVKREVLIELLLDSVLKKCPSCTKELIEEPSNDDCLYFILDKHFLTAISKIDLRIANEAYTLVNSLRACQNLPEFKSCCICQSRLKGLINEFV